MRRSVAATLRSLCVVLCTSGMVLGALDAVHGPREHYASEDISHLQRQLQDAVLSGDTKLNNITNLLTAGADANGYDEYHMTPLHWAVIKGQRLAVELLLDRGAHTDVRDSSDRTPMHFVGIYGFGEMFPSILTALYFAGANLNAGDQSHNTVGFQQQPLLLFCFCFASPGTDAHTTQPLHLAAFEGQTATVQELIKYGAKMDVANRWAQRTPLGMAILGGECFDGRPPCVRARARVNRSAPSNLHSTGHEQTAQALKDAGAEDEFISGFAARNNPSDLSFTTLAKCDDDRSNIASGADKWGCHQNDFFMQDQPIIEPQPPGPPEAGEQLHLIQGTCVS